MNINILKEPYKTKFSKTFDILGINTYKKGFKCIVCDVKISDDDFIRSNNIKWNIETNAIFHKDCQVKEEVEEQMERDKQFDFNN